MKTVSGGNCVYLAMVVMALIAAGCGKKPVVETSQRTIVFFGDSVTAGYGVKEGTSFYDRIAYVMKKGVYGSVVTYNAGVSGDDTNEALRRIPDVKALNPDIIVIAFGLNDCQSSGITPRQYIANIKIILSQMPRDTKPVLATSNTFMDTGQELWTDLNRGLEGYMEELRKLARDNNYPLIDVNDVWKEKIRSDSRNMENLYADPTHPSSDGHRLIYETYMTVIRKVLMQ